MPTQYNGVADNAFAHASKNIASSTNASPIVVHFSAAHDLSNGDRLILRNHAVNTAANGIWAVHVVNATDVALYFTYGGAPSVGNGVGAATGTARGVGLLPTFAIPNDGEDIDAASVNVAFEANGDAGEAIWQNVGKFYIDQDYPRAVNTGSYATLTSWIHGSCNIGGWTRGAAADFFTGAPYLNVMQNDVVDVEFDTSYVQLTPAGASSAMWFALGYELFPFGTAPTNTPVKIDGSARFVNYLDAVNAALDNQPFPKLRAQLTVPALGGGDSMQQMQVYLIAQALGAVAGPYVYDLAGDRAWHSMVRRPTTRAY